MSLHIELRAGIGHEEELSIANLADRKQRITLEHLLTMSDGMDWHELDYPYADPCNTLGRMWNSRDAVQHVLDQPMVREPGFGYATNPEVSEQDLAARYQEHLDAFACHTAD